MTKAKIDGPRRHQKDLLPCPFCGSTDVWCGQASATSRKVWCQNCGAQTKDLHLPWANKQGRTILQLWKELDRQATGLWNRREKPMQKNLPIIVKQGRLYNPPPGYLSKTVYIGRGPGDENYGNPFSHLAHTTAAVQTETREESINFCRSWLKGEGFRHIQRAHRRWILEHLEDLWNSVLVCHCDPLPCHGQVYIEFLRGDHGPVAQYLRIK